MKAMESGNTIESDEDSLEKKGNTNNGYELNELVNVFSLQYLITKYHYSIVY